jgi:hypothetical protein
MSAWAWRPRDTVASPHGVSRIGLIEVDHNNMSQRYGHASAIAMGILGSAVIQAPTTAAASK